MLEAYEDPLFAKATRDLSAMARIEDLMASRPLSGRARERPFAPSKLFRGGQRPSGRRKAEYPAAMSLLLRLPNRGESF